MFSLTAPLDVNTARNFLFCYLLARQDDNSAVAIRFAADHAADQADFSTAWAEVAHDLQWLELAVSGAPLFTSARCDHYVHYLKQLVAADATRSHNGVTQLLVRPGPVIVDDALSGQITFDASAVGDITLGEVDGAVDPAFAAAIDSALIRSPLVVRDDRQLERSARDVLILRALRLTPPHYLHLGSILPDSSEVALPLISDLRRAGFLPAALINHLALLGWSPRDGEGSLTLAELSAQFSLERVHRVHAHFNEARLRSLNARALQTLPAGDRAALVAAAMQRAGLLEDPIPAAARRWIDTFLSAYSGSFSTLGEALALVADLRAEAVVVPALQLERLRNRQVVFYLDAVGQYVDAQPELRELPLDHDLPAIADEFGIAHTDAFAVVRLALMGQPDGPPLGLLFPLLGHDRILMRIGAISSHLLHGRGLEPIKYGPGGVTFQTIQATAPEPRANTAH